MAKNKVVICSKFFIFAVKKTTSRKSSKMLGVAQTSPLCFNLITIQSVRTHLCPTKIHFFVVVLDKFTNDANFFVGKRTKKRYENLC